MVSSRPVRRRKEGKKEGGKKEDFTQKEPGTT
jgi:hypothetical protein